jgi:hypothetical protein
MQRLQQAARHIRAQPPSEEPSSFQSPCSQVPAAAAGPSLASSPRPPPVLLSDSQVQTSLLSEQTNDSWFFVQL